METPTGSRRGFSAILGHDRDEVNVVTMVVAHQLFQAKLHYRTLSRNDFLSTRNRGIQQCSRQRTVQMRTGVEAGGLISPKTNQYEKAPATRINAPSVNPGAYELVRATRNPVANGATTPARFATKFAKPVQAPTWSSGAQPCGKTQMLAQLNPTSVAPAISQIAIDTSQFNLPQLPNCLNLRGLQNF